MQAKDDGNLATLMVLMKSSLKTMTRAGPMTPYFMRPSFATLTILPPHPYPPSTIRLLGRVSSIRDDILRELSPVECLGVFPKLCELICDCCFRPPSSTPIAWSGGNAVFVSRFRSTHILFRPT